MKHLFLILFLSFYLVGCSSIKKSSDKINISKDLVLTKINKKSFIVKDIAFYNSNVFVSKMDDGTLVIVSSLIDTARTDIMMSWIKENLTPKKIIAINTHFHADSTGGNESYTKNNVEIWSTKATHLLYQKRAESMQSSLAKDISNKELSKYVLDRKNLPAQNFFDAKEGKTWNFGNEKVIAFYPGPGHTEDNIVVYFPNQKLLFGGCLLRSKSWTSLGNTKDANIEKYYSSVKKLLDFEAETVIPGHGDIGGKNLIHHTMDIALKAKPK